MNPAETRQNALGPRQQAVEAEIDRDVASWLGEQDAEAYRRAMRKTTAYKAAQLSDAMRALFYAAVRPLGWVPKP